MKIIESIDADIKAARKRYSQKKWVPTGIVRKICREYYKKIKNVAGRFKCWLL